MSQQNENGFKTFVAAEAIAQYLRVKLNGSGQAALAGLNEPAIGIAQRGVASGEMCPVRLLNCPGTFKMKASAAITAYAKVFGTASGKIDDTTQPGLAGGCLGTALEAATADGDIIEILVESGINGLQMVAGQHTTVAAIDTVVTGLATVYGAVASLDANPGDDPFLVSASIGDQAGTPAAGSILIKTWKHDGTDPTPTAASTFTKKVNWIAWGK